MFKINLVPEVQEEKQKVAKTTSVTVIVSVIIVVITLLILLTIAGILAVDQLSLVNTKNAIETTNSEIAKYADLEKTVLSLENGLTEVKKIINGQNSWTKLLPHLEAATPNDVKFTKLTLEPGKVTAGLEGKDVNSLARFVESYKKYQVIVFSGSAGSQDSVTLQIDDAAPVTLPVKTNGTYTYATTLDLSQNHTVKVSKGDQQATLNYDASTKKISSTDSSVSTKVANLFTGVEVKQYTKSDKVTFDATIKFEQGLLW